jgi:hypothetical protein
MEVVLDQNYIDFFILKKIYFTFDGSDRFQNGQKLYISENTIVEPYSAVLSGVTIPTIGAFSYTWSSLPCEQKIGRYCSIAANVSNLSTRHPKDVLSTSSFIYDPNFIIYKQAVLDCTGNFHPVYNSHLPYEYAVIEHDVWIGEGALLGRNITISTGSIVGARSVVTKDVPPYAIVAGNPAEIKGYRFEPNLINALLESRWWEYSFANFSDMDIDKPEKFLVTFEALRNEGKLVQLLPENEALLEQLKNYLSSKHTIVDVDSESKVQDLFEETIKLIDLEEVSDIAWLSVGGCPRSGTTALGAALNMHKNISLLHEYDSSKFWITVNNFFDEEQRLNTYIDTSIYSSLMPVYKRDVEKIAKSLVDTIFGKNSSIIGTKFPGLHLWPSPDIPNFIPKKEIHITRNPFDTVLSYSKKNVYDGLFLQEEILDSAKESLAYWVSAYNYAISRCGDKDFFHIFYDEIIFDSSKYETDLANFLGIDNIDLSGMKIIDSNRNIKNKFESAGLINIYEEISQLFPYEGWLEFARAAFINREYKVLENNIFLGARDIYYSYIQYISDGFYPAEADGVWTTGSRSSIRFCPIGLSIGKIMITLVIKWALYINDEWPKVTVVLNGDTIADFEIEMQQNGDTQSYFIIVPRWYSSVADIEFLIHNPKNPKKIGISDDNRELGFMLSSISFKQLSRFDQDLNSFNLSQMIDNELIDHLNEQLYISQKNNLYIEEKVNKLQKDLQTKEEHITKNEEKIVELENRIQDRDKELQTKEEHITKNEEKIVELENRIQDRDKELQTKEENLAKYEEKIVELEKYVEQINTTFLGKINTFVINHKIKN